MKAMVWRGALVFGVLFAVTALGVGCGKDTVVAYEDDVESEGPDGVTFKDSASGEDGQGGGGKDLYIDPDEDGEIRYDIVLLHNTMAPEVILVGGRLTVMAKVIDYYENKPAAHYPVRFRVLDSSPMCTQAPPCGRFLSMEGITDAEGRVSVTFEGGEQGSQMYTVELDGAKAHPVIMDIRVNELPKGELRVRFKYEGSVNIHTLNVRVTKGFKSCTQFSAIAPWNTDLVGQKVVTGVDSMPSFPDLLTTGTYQVFATAKGPTNNLTAAGCVDAVHVLPDEQGITDVTLNLYLLALNPAGTYDTTNHFDFTGAIPGQVGEIVNLVVNIFYNPGAVLIDLVKTLVSQYIGSWVTNLAFGLFEDALANVITNWLLNNSPPFIQDFFIIGKDLVQIVKNLEMQSQLKISKLGSDYSVQGIQNWHGITLYWKLGCDPNAPDYPSCGAFPFSLMDLQNTDFPMDLIAGQFTAMVANYNYLIIDTHKININYGKLILFVINNMLLPAISNYNSLTALLYSIIDCHAIAYGIVGDVLSAIGIDRQVVENTCNQAEAFIVGPIEGIISSLSIDSRLRIHGRCQMLDGDDNLIVDSLYDGIWLGHIEIGADEGEEFEGTFFATRATYPGN
jgi:hypothetical protein